jgi:hypothetical protein
LVAAVLLAVMTLTIEVASHHATHSHAGNGSAREPAFDVLPTAFWCILAFAASLNEGWKKFTNSRTRHTISQETSKIPWSPFGGDTLFANMYLAYEASSAGVKRLLDCWWR